MSNDMIQPDFPSGVTDFTAGDSGVSGITVAPASFSSTIAKPAAAKKNEVINIYSVLLLIALLAIIAGTGLLALEWGRYNYETEPTLQRLPRSDRAGELCEWI